MTERRYYRNAPVREAVIDVQVTPQDGLAHERLGALAEQERDRYPNVRPIHFVEGEFKAHVSAEGREPVLTSSAKSAVLGTIMSSADGRQVLQVRRDGFAFSRLHPYERWESVRDEARRLWQSYRQLLRSVNVRRIALRYINRLDIPLPVKDLRDYLRVRPELAHPMNQTLSQLFMQLQIPYPTAGATLNLTEALVPAEKSNTIAIILDVDLWSVEVVRDDLAMWARFEQLHMCKNEVFEACITDEARRLFA